MTVRSIRELFDIENSQGGVGDGFAENRFGVGPESRIQFFRRAVRGEEGEFHTHLPHGDGKEIVGAAVNGGRSDHMVPGSGNIENSKEVRGLAGRGQHRGSTAFHGADLRGDHIVGRILKAGVEITGSLQVEEFAHILAGVVLEGGGLDDRDLAGFSVPRRIPGLDTERFNVRHGNRPPLKDFNPKYFTTTQEKEQVKKPK